MDDIIKGQEIIAMSDITIVGISKKIKFGNEAEEIPLLWNKFISEDTINKISNKINNEIYQLYYDYDMSKMEYKTLIGVKVSSIKSDDNLDSVFIPSSKYLKINVKSGPVENIKKAWEYVWNLFGKENKADINGEILHRSFKADFDLHSENCKPDNMVVSIYVGLA